jgi:acyl dehydratase
LTVPIEPAVVGTELDPVTLAVDAARLRFFAKAIGEKNPIFFDDAAAAAAGHSSLPVPPTFLFSIELEAADPFGWITGLGVDLRFILHGEQEFIYHSVAHAGDILIARPRITDVYQKKGGALEFLVKESIVERADGSAVADLRSVIVVRHSGGGE